MAVDNTELIGQLGCGDAEIVGSETLHSGFFDFVSHRIRHRLFAGGWSDSFDRELFERGNAAAILLFDPQSDSVALVEQFRVGALAATLPSGEPSTPWLLEIVAGIIEPGETAQDVACRESEEEAGAEVLAVEHIAGYFPSPGACSEYIELFCGRIDAASMGGLHGLDSENEDIRLHIVPRQQAMTLLAQGRLNNASTIIALQWLQLNAERLQQAWG
ncbi:ADP-ribose pyrophosphatase [Sinobacterium norvegicum]|uniref:ADP-ribose pyrophosphatase n=1 Tax=Sinobacterium norvegicum TaxID=1641715 RepID=A0ABN8ELH4_9GAMM|nr:NUDIX domain-containing protein [Sinobacterium norvegicum]CAH0993197.1 ADP-ribose pyrophosphatase [Sinobacterium norvegicum]